MSKLLVATQKPFAQNAVDNIKSLSDSAGYELILLEKYADKNELLNAVSDATALIVRSDKVDSEIIDAAKELKIVVRAGAGYDNIDLEAASRKGLVVMNTPGQNSNAVAELALGMMVYIARNNFNGTSGTELFGKKLGIHGYGNVGKNITRIAKGFGMDVFTFHPRLDNSIIIEGGVTPLNSHEELYSTCQYISVNIPARKENVNAVTYELMAKMPAGAMLVNTARKEVVDEASLIRMMSARPDFKYVSDIIPDNKDEIEEKFEGQYFFTPKKMGAQTSEANINAGIAAANQIINFLKNGDNTFQVNNF